MSTGTVSACAISEQQAYDLGAEAFSYLYPLVLMEVTRRQTTNAPAGQRPGFGPMNAFSHIRAYPDADFKAVVRPNFDTLYSSAWLDLTREPVVISVDDTNGRYYLLPMLDMWTDVIAAPGWRTSGTQAQQIAVVPPGWSGTLPAGMQRVDATTSYLWVIGRIKTDGPNDYAAVHRIQDSLSVTPLSAWGAEAKPPEQKIDSSIDMKTPPLETVNAMSLEDFFAYAGELLKVHAPHKTDWSMITRLRGIGFETGKSFDLKKLDGKLLSEFSRGAKDAMKNMGALAKKTGRPVNGWAMNTDTMGVYGNFYVKRAIVALVGLGANQPEDAIYPLNFADADGEPLVGENKYVLHFSANEIPPANAFWSLTMYDSAGFQVANVLNRFAISSWMPLKFNSDGSLNLYIQHETPGADRESNWLPAPAKGELGVTLRLYAPQGRALSGEWNPPAVRKA